MVVLQEALQTIGQIVLDREAFAHLIRDCELLFESLVFAFHFRQSHPDNINHVSEDRSPQDLHDNDYNNLVFILRRNVAIANCNHSCEGPVKRKNIFGIPLREAKIVFRFS
jgi:hypothetical protein